MVGDFLFKSSNHEFLTSHQVSVSRPVPKRTLRKWQMTDSKTGVKQQLSGPVNYRDFRDPEADAASISVSLKTARESYGRRLSFQEF